MIKLFFINASHFSPSYKNKDNISNMPEGIELRHIGFGGIKKIYEDIMIRKTERIR